MRKKSPKSAAGRRLANGVLEMHCAYALRTGGMFNDMEIHKTRMEGL